MGPKAYREILKYHLAEAHGTCGRDYSGRRRVERGRAVWGGREGARARGIVGREFPGRRECRARLQELGREKDAHAL